MKKIFMLTFITILLIPNIYNYQTNNEILNKSFWLKKDNLNFNKTVDEKGPKIPNAYDSSKLPVTNILNAYNSKNVVIDKMPNPFIRKNLKF